MCKTFDEQSPSESLERASELASERCERLVEGRAKMQNKIKQHHK